MHMYEYVRGQYPVSSWIAHHLFFAGQTLSLNLKLPDYLESDQQASGI